MVVQEQEMELPENETLKRCSPSQPSAQICACFLMKSTNKNVPRKPCFDIKNYKYFS
jgi:hypothetical protein